MLLWPAARGGAQPSRRLSSGVIRGCLRPFLKPDGELDAAPGKVAALVAAWEFAPAQVRRSLRVSRHFGPWLERKAHRRSRGKARTKFIGDVERGKARLRLVLDPELVGPLFRFNRAFYALDECGRPVDYNKLGELRSRLAPVMLRRWPPESDRYAWSGHCFASLGRAEIVSRTLSLRHNCCAAGLGQRHATKRHRS
jgi:hypothetical protein